MSNSLKKILIVDDISTNRVLLKIMCEKLGYSCDLAGSGKEALELIKKNSYNLVFLDCQMPFMDGYEVSREIRKLEKLGEEVPIIAITAYLFSENKDKCLAAGMTDFINKPLKKHELKIITDRWLKNKHSEQNKEKEYQNPEKNVSIEIEPTDNKNQNDEVIKLFVESTAIKIMSFEKYLYARDAKFCKILAAGIMSNFKLVNLNKLLKISSNLLTCCEEQRYKECEKILDKLKVEFENYAKENNFDVKF